MIEHFFNCPYCWANISILITPDAEFQHYIEDCEVCCNPIEFEIVLNEAQITKFEISKPG